MPCTLRCPSDQTAEPGMGLSAGIDPSLFNRKIFPEDVRVLRVRAVLGVAGRHVKLSVGAELHPTAVVVVVAGDPVDDDGLLGPKSVLVAHAHDFVARRATGGRVAVIEVDEIIARELGIECDPEEALLTIGACARRQRCPRIRAKPAARPELHDAHSPGALGDEETPVWREIDGPWRA